MRLLKGQCEKSENVLLEVELWGCS